MAPFYPKVPSPVLLSASGEIAWSWRSLSKQSGCSELHVLVCLQQLPVASECGNCLSWNTSSSSLHQREVTWNRCQLFWVRIKQCFKEATWIEKEPLLHQLHLVSQLSLRFLFIRLGDVISSVELSWEGNEWMKCQVPVWHSLNGSHFS